MKPVLPIVIVVAVVVATAHAGHGDPRPLRRFSDPGVMFPVASRQRPSAQTGGGQVVVTKEGNSGRSRSQLCQYFSKAGRCPNDKCSFAHQQPEDKPLPYKTRRCWFFSGPGTCPNGDKCTFIHDVSTANGPAASATAKPRSSIPSIDLSNVHLPGSGRCSCPKGELCRTIQGAVKSAPLQATTNNEFRNPTPAGFVPYPVPNAYMHHPIPVTGNPMPPPSNLNGTPFPSGMQGAGHCWVPQGMTFSFAGQVICPYRGHPIGWVPVAQVQGAHVSQPNPGAVEWDRLAAEYAPYQTSATQPQAQTSALAQNGDPLVDMPLVRGLRQPRSLPNMHQPGLQQTQGLRHQHSMPDMNQFGQTTIPAQQAPPSWNPPLFPGMGHPIRNPTGAATLHQQADAPEDVYKSPPGLPHPAPQPNVDTARPQTLLRISRPLPKPIGDGSWPRFD